MGDYDERGMSKGAIAGTISAGAAVLSLAAYAFSPRVTEREAAIKIVRGELTNAQVTDGLKFDALLPHVEYICLPKFLQRMTVKATESDAVAVRTKEKAQVFGEFEIHYNLDNSRPEFGDIYTRLKCDEITDLEPFIANYALPAIIDTYRTIPTASVNDNLTGIGKSIAAALQRTLDENGYPYIRIQDVIPSGVGLSPKANADLEQIVSEERKLDLQRVQMTVADNAIALTEKQAAVTAKALESLRAAGVPEDQLIAAYYLQLLRDSDSIGRPLVPGPIPGTGVSGVVTPK